MFFKNSFTSRAAFWTLKNDYVIFAWPAIDQSLLSAFLTGLNFSETLCRSKLSRLLHVFGIFLFYNRLSVIWNDSWVFLLFISFEAFLTCRRESHVTYFTCKIVFFPQFLPLARYCNVLSDYLLYSAFVDGVRAFTLSLYSPFFTAFEMNCVFFLLHLKYFIGSWLLLLHSASMANTVNQTCPQRAL